MAAPPNVQELRLSLKAFDNQDTAALLGEIPADGIARPVGRLLSKLPEFDARHSFVLRVHACLTDGRRELLHSACAYRFENFSVQADAWSAKPVRRAGFHHPGLARRVVYCEQVDGLPTENILVLPQLGPDWTHKMKEFGFDPAACNVRRAVPLAVRELRQPIFSLSAEGLKRMRENATTAFQSQLKLFQDVPFIDETYLGREYVQRGLQGGARIFRLPRFLRDPA